MLKENSKDLKIKEQIVFNDSSGLTIEFVVNEKDVDCPYRIRLYGESLPFGNREIIIDKDGKVDGGGTFVGSCPFPYESFSE